MPFERRAVKDTLQRVAGKYAGKATFFRPADEGGPTGKFPFPTPHYHHCHSHSHSFFLGSCGPHETDDDMIVALVSRTGDINLNSAHTLPFFFDARICISTAMKTR